MRPADSVAITNAIANVDVLRNDYFETIDQSNDACFYYPILGPGELVMFPGQCGNITAMPNFNATAVCISRFGNYYLLKPKNDDKLSEN